MSFLGKFRSKKVIAVLVVLAALAIAGGVLYVKYNDLKKENARLSNPQSVAQAETERLKAEVGALIDLPNETPTIATVVDPDKLKSQPFFANAQKDDKVLIFTQAKKAILYRPSTKKIIEVAPINIGDSSKTQGSSTEEQQSTPTNTNRR